MIEKIVNQGIMKKSIDKENSEDYIIVPPRILYHGTNFDHLKYCFKHLDSFLIPEKEVYLATDSGPAMKSAIELATQLDDIPTVLVIDTDKLEAKLNWEDGWNANRLNFGCFQITTVQYRYNPVKEELHMQIEQWGERISYWAMELPKKERKMV